LLKFAMKEKSMLGRFFIVLFFVVQVQVYGQQDPLYTQYYNNYSLINPAYAGSHGFFTATAYLCGPWVAKSGGPESMSLSIHGATEKNFGIGFSVVHNNEYMLNETRAFLDFSYSMDVSKYSTLALGIKSGGRILKVDYEKIGISKEDLFQENVNEFKQNLGIGAFYYSDNHYASLSIIDLFRIPFYDQSLKTIQKINRMKFYLSAGYIHEINDDLKMKPSFMIKTLNDRIVSTDISTNILWKDQIEFGLSYRLDKAVSGILQVALSDCVKLSYSINTVSKRLNGYSGPSQDIKLSFDLNTYGKHSYSEKAPFYW